MQKDLNKIKTLQNEISQLKERLVYYEKILEQSKKEQESCSENQEKYRSLFDNAIDAVMVMTADHFVECNQKTEELFGCGREQLVKKGVLDFSPEFQPDGKKSAEAALQYIGAAFSGEPQFINWQFLRADGMPFNCEMSLTSIELKGEIYLQAIVRDVSLRVETERALYERNLQYESLFRNSMLGIWRMEFKNPVSVEQKPAQIAQMILDEGYFSECNEALLSMYNAVSKEELSVADINLFGTNKREALEYFELFAANNFSTALLETQGKDKNGKEKSFRFSYSGYVENNVLQWVWGIQLDLTEQKMLEKQFLQSQKMEAIGMLAGGIAHDFNNLLTVINGYSDLITSKISVENPVFKNILSIRKAGEKAANLTSQLLAFSRKQILQPKIVILNDIIEKMMKMVERLIGETITVETDLAQDLGRIKVDPVKIEQIIMNLSVNARDAMPKGGKLHFETRNFTIDKAFTDQHSGAKTGQYVLLSVSDTGMGMSEKIITNIFDPFFTTKDKATNTGLGLSTIYGIVKQSSGFITVDSSPENGACFNIYLPRVEETINLDDDGMIFKTGTEIEGDETILLVEDAENVREVIRESLESCGYTIIEAEDGEEALRKVALSREKIHLVLTDVVMPKMDGQVFVLRLKPILPEAKVIFMSGYTQDALVKKGEIEQGIDFIQKPFNLIDLARRIRMVLDKPDA